MGGKCSRCDEVYIDFCSESKIVIGTYVGMQTVFGKMTAGLV